jgi:F420-non-reducing hydrogenase large subunit
MCQGAEEWLELTRDPEITKTNIRNIPTKVVGEGIGVVEAPRGTLFHHYNTDEKGIIKKANLIVATGNNYAAMNISIRNAAKSLIKDGKVDDGLLNMVEMASRAYDPCFGCATHTLPGQMPMEASIYDHKGRLYRVLRKNMD